MTSQVLTDSSNTVRYKVLSESGQILSVEPSKMLAEMYVDRLPDNQKSACIIVPITEDNKDILLG